MLAENSRGEMIIVEVQNNRELDYFHRVLYGISKKVITEYINSGEPYGNVKKAYSIDIVYFDLGQANDYAYRSRIELRGIHTGDLLQLSASQREQFIYRDTGTLFLEHYVLRVDKFDKEAVTPLDEWISFLKTGDIPESAKAGGLPEARERLRRDRLSKEEQRAYDAHLEALRYQRSVIQTGIIEGEEKGREEGLVEGLAKGRAEGLVEGEEKRLIDIVHNCKRNGFSMDQIQLITGCSEERILEILRSNAAPKSAPPSPPYS
jgi:predicted transposase/invertase (TIGR01784 family)